MKRYNSYFESEQNASSSQQDAQSNDDGHRGGKKPQYNKRDYYESGQYMEDSGERGGRGRNRGGRGGRGQRQGND